MMVEIEIVVKVVYLDYFVIGTYWDIYSYLTEYNEITEIFIVK